LRIRMRFLPRSGYSNRREILTKWTERFNFLLHAKSLAFFSSN
jgi:hypothetical protein